MSMWIVEIFRMSVDKNVIVVDITIMWIVNFFIMN